MPRADGSSSRSGKHALTGVQSGITAVYRRLRPLVFAKYGTRCHWCGVQTIPARPPAKGRARDPRERTVDHLIPRSRSSGRHPLTVDDLRPCCWRCNSSRGNRTRPGRSPRTVRVPLARTSRAWL